MRKSALKSFCTLSSLEEQHKESLVVFIHIVWLFSVYFSGDVLFSKGWEIVEKQPKFPLSTSRLFSFNKSGITLWRQIQNSKQITCKPSSFCNSSRLLTSTDNFCCKVVLAVLETSSLLLDEFVFEAETPRRKEEDEEDWKKTGLFVSRCDCTKWRFIVYLQTG